MIKMMIMATGLLVCFGCTGTVTPDDSSPLPQPPQIDPVLDIQVDEGVPIEAIDLNDGGDDFDADGDTITYSCVFDKVLDDSVEGGEECNTLSGFLFDPSSGEISWTPDNDQAGDYEFEVTASDGELFDSLIFKITVNAVVQIEDFGGLSFYRPYYGTLDVTPNGDGTSSVVYTGSEDVFSSEFQDKELVLFRIHKNPRVISEQRDYFPNLVGSRYSSVLSVIDNKTLLVDFEYNGEDAASPKATRGASGYFFFDNKPAFLEAILSDSREETIVMKSGGIYVIKGAFDVITPSHIKFKTQEGYEAKARIKLSAEDVMDGGIFSERWFNLNDDDFNIRFENINIVGPHYTVPVVSDNGFNSGFFGGNDPAKQSARILEIRGSDDWTEYRELEANGDLAVLPEGYNFVGPNFVHGIIYGGKHDGTDVTDMIYLNCIDTSMHPKEFSSMKSTVSAGIYKRIIGESPENMSEIIEQDIPENRINLVKVGGAEGGIATQLSFGEDSKTGSNRLVRIEGSASWYQLANQYWTGGTSTGSTSVTRIEIDGYELMLGNNGDWWWKYPDDIGDYKYPIEDALSARIFEQIPVVGDIIKVGKLALRDDAEQLEIDKFDVWGWGLQVGDVLSVNGADYTITNKVRKSIEWSLLQGQGNTGGGSVINLMTITLDPPPPSGTTSFEVTQSQTEYLLDGIHEGSLVYDRDYHGHLFYDDFNFPYHFENVKLRGYFRGSQKDHEGLLYKMAPIDADGYGKKWINVDYDDDSPNPQHWWSRILKERALAEGRDEDAYSILVKGPYTKIGRFYQTNPNNDTVELVDNPDISLARLANPIIQDSVKGTQFFIQATGGHDVQIDTVEMLATEGGWGRFGFISDGGQLTVNNFVTHQALNGSENYAALSINYTQGMELTPATASTQIMINAGRGAIVLRADGETAAFTHGITIHNWELVGFPYGGDLVYEGFSPGDFENFCDQVSITDTNGDSLQSECP
jgi:hypothetical protein